MSEEIDTQAKELQRQATLLLALDDEQQQLILLLQSGYQARSRSAHAEITARAKRIAASIKKIYKRIKRSVEETNRD